MNAYTESTPSGEPVRLCAGQGRTFTLTDPGKYVEMSGYHTVSWSQICWMAQNPTKAPKDSGWWVIPSSETGRLARLASTQLDRGIYWILIADLDHGNLSAQDVIAGVQEALDPGTEFLIYSTASSTEDAKRWRIMVPIPGCPGRFYHHSVDLFNRALAAVVGVALDDCTNRIHQIAFLPNRGEHYEWYHQPGSLFGMGQDQTKARILVQKAIEFTNAQPAASTSTSRTTERGHYLEQFARRFPVDGLLDRYGFITNDGVNYNHLTLQTTGSYGTCITADGRWLTASQSLQTFLGRNGGDSFDLYAAFECGGDREKAFQNVCRAISTGGQPTNEPPQTETRQITCGGVVLTLEMPL